MTGREDTQNLNTIIEAKRYFLQKRQEKIPNVAVLALAEMQERPVPVLNIVTGGDHVTLIGQICLEETYDPVAAGLRYMRDGAEAVSFLTDQRIYSKGMEDLLLVARGIRNAPMICQDYILNEYHVTEVRATGASAVVAYSAVLDQQTLRNIVSLAHRWKMTSIVQVSDEKEMTYAASLSPHVIGFGDGFAQYFDRDRDLPIIRRLAPMMPFHARMMPLGCLQEVEDVAAVVQLGVDAIIVAESLIATQEPYEQLRALLDRRSSRW